MAFIKSVVASESNQTATILFQRLCDPLRLCLRRVLAHLGWAHWLSSCMMHVVRRTAHVIGVVPEPDHWVGEVAIVSHRAEASRAQEERHAVHRWFEPDPARR